jgi:hypothetical protein
MADHDQDEERAAVEWLERLRGLYGNETRKNVATLLRMLAQPRLPEPYSEDGNLLMGSIESDWAAAGMALPRLAARLAYVLDKQFDEVKGVYLDGYSDQRVGEETKVPWASVRELREAAYGPLRSVPELETLRAETERVVAALKALEKLAGDLSRRIAEATQRLGVEP